MKTILFISLVFFCCLKGRISVPESVESIHVPEIQLKSDSLPIHGTHSRATLNEYYPNILDTIKDVRIVVAERIMMDVGSGVIVSMLQNTGTFNQMILCTHSKNFELLDHHYIGKARQFDRTSHTIKYKLIGTDELEFQHIDWGWVDKNGELVIDNLDQLNYVLSISNTGLIQ